MCEGLKKQLRRLETLGKPVVAALNGTALRWWFRNRISLSLPNCIKQSKSTIWIARSGPWFIARWWRHHPINKNDWLQPALPFLTEGKRN
jgi:hypothetical protein